MHRIAQAGNIWSREKDESDSFFRQNGRVTRETASEWASTLNAHAHARLAPAQRVYGGLAGSVSQHFLDHLTESQQNLMDVEQHDFVGAQNAVCGETELQHGGPVMWFPDDRRRPAAETPHVEQATGFTVEMLRGSYSLDSNIYEHRYLSAIGK